MENFFGILIVAVFLFIALRPMLQRWLAPWLSRWVAGKMEDRFRRMAGMPTRKEERKARKSARKREKEGARRFRDAAAGRRRNAGGFRSASNGVDMLRSYAEDVEYTEIKSYSSNIEIGEDPKSGNTHIKIEEQIEDVEFEEIKKN